MTTNGFKEISEKAYICVTCHTAESKLNEQDLICETCSQCCHQGHEKKLVGNKDFICQCQFTMGLYCNLSTCCTFKYTGQKYLKQVMYSCSTDGMSIHKSVCAYCARECHSDHKLIRSTEKLGYCRCPGLFKFCKSRLKVKH